MLFVFIFELFDGISVHEDAWTREHSKTRWGLSKITKNIPDVKHFTMKLIYILSENLYESKCKKHTYMIYWTPKGNN